MAKFKVGDRARIIYSVWYPERVGKECTILEVDPVGLSGKREDYAIIIDGIDGHPISGRWVIDEGQLEPIVDLGSWDELQKTINWNPTKELNHVE